MLRTYGAMDFLCKRDHAGVALAVNFDLAAPRLLFDCQLSKGDAFSLEFTQADHESWGRAVRVYFLLCRYADLVSADFVLARLEPVSVLPTISPEPGGDA